MEGSFERVAAVSAGRGVPARKVQRESTGCSSVEVRSPRGLCGCSHHCESVPFVVGLWGYGEEDKERGRAVGGENMQD